MELGRNYKKDGATSYALGASLTYELLKTHPDWVMKVYFHSAFLKSAEYPEFTGLCDAANIAYMVSDRIFNRLSNKENCLVIGEFSKSAVPLDHKQNQLVLVNPGNMGNLGTIIRAAIGFGIRDIALIRPAVDIYDPKTIRASMGAFFYIRFAYFDCFADYQRTLTNQTIYTFRLNADNILGQTAVAKRYVLVFGNESRGLDPAFDQIGTGLVIRHTHDIDSLSLPIAVSIALYEFNR